MILKDYCTSTIMIEQIQEKDILKEYESFSKWILESCNTDLSQVNKKHLKYLVTTYKSLCEDIEKELSFEVNKEYLKAIKKVKKSSRQLEKYLKKVQKEHEEYYCISAESKGYEYYDSMSQWYEIKKELTKKILKKQSNNAQEALIEERKKIFGNKEFSVFNDEVIQRVNKENEFKYIELEV